MIKRRPPRPQFQCQGFDSDGLPCQHATPGNGNAAYCRPCRREIEAAEKILPSCIPDGWQPRRFTDAAA